MPSLQQLKFFITVNHLSDLPQTLAEVAFAGRSNAGKSSAINTLAKHTRLAFTSKTPGRTQHINFFQITDGVHVVDLPGYGYAQVPNAVRKHWEGLLGDYLRLREQLKGLVVIMDSRHPLKDLDWQMLEWFAPTKKPIHILLTKADKLTRQECAKQLSLVKKAVADWPQVSVQLFSSLKKSGVEEAEATVLSWLYPAEPEEVSEVL
ncbi:ribosome biogenesis GTP-binding protein YihA/YsxC [Leeia sp. TBRC 13508]|uniref:Probable GTP-binding protein EngB n=1 Tax=Leeia speluncae TaxID=2884804 RepID=A0ABS8D5M9_9NEIS|nr:ribosome biogenesis GTP-binding protein YihA/YsxC [Leeia speluncae]MCB6183432.1 ribosome biogenesis GTP-binding protein YihA/YsxC [Leeia speluncae]